LLFLIACSVNAQQSYNMSLLGKLNYDQGLNDVWGYVDKSGNEYAIVGVVNGTSIVDVTDPSEPTELFFIAGPTSVWRDMKTYGDYAYIVHDSFSNGESQGLLIIDLSDIENGNIATNSIFSLTYSRFHNIFIDENGVAYLFGGDYDNGGVLMYDLTTDPQNPIYLGEFEEAYLHDGMVRGDTLWGSAVYEGLLMAIDVSDKSNLEIIGTVSTPHSFTHNAWVSDDGNTVFTTDEVAGAYIAAVDVSDVSNMTVIDQIQSWSPETDVIPHNTHVMGKYLVTSYYCDGVTVVDASDPTNLQEVAYYDTSFSSGGTFSGAWGAYPWLPSGNILVSDRQEGLHVLAINNLDFSTEDLEDLLDVKISSNPTSDQFIVHVNKEYVLKVYSIDGCLVDIIETSSTVDRLSIGSDWKAGTYILKVSNSEGLSASYKLIKSSL
jgi:choice-of-anchor B domain-containing protein